MTMARKVERRVFFWGSICHLTQVVDAICLFWSQEKGGAGGFIPSMIENRPRLQLTACTASKKASLTWRRSGGCSTPKQRS